MLISVITISKNTIDEIRACLDSVLNQTYKDFEIVIVDSSSNGTRMIIQEYEKKDGRIRVVFQESKGVGAARNEGLRSARGDVLVSVDTDCYLSTDFLEKVAAAISSPRAMGVRVRVIVESREKTFFSSLVRSYERIMLNAPEHWLVAMRREFVDQVGMFEDSLEVGEDQVYDEKLEAINKKLEHEGFQFPVVDALLVESKKGETFRQYWKRLMWYAEAYCNRKFLSANHNALKLVASLYVTFIPLIVLLFYIFGKDPILPLLPLLSVIIYIYARAIERTRTLRAILLPVVLYYKAMFTALGFLTAAARSHRTANGLHYRL
jgi:glycosyltransferase involved in cell wall biosynthesis